MNGNTLRTRNTAFFAAAGFAATALFLFLPSYAYAQQVSPMGYVMCYIVAIVYGNLGRGLAALSVVIVGIGAMLGKTSWGLALTVTTGIATVFGAIPLTSSIMFATGAFGSPITGICFGASGVW